MKFIKVLIAMILLSSSASAFANQAHVCKSATVSSPSGNINLTDDTVFTCGGSVSGTLPQLAEQGWSIVQITDESLVNPSDTSLDSSKVFAQLVIQK